MPHKVRLALDAMGGDHGAAVVADCIRALDADDHRGFCWQVGDGGGGVAHPGAGSHGVQGYAPMLGVLAFGDSITNGGGELQWGVALQSWAQWLARAYGMPYSGWAVDGATANDVRGFDWDPEAYAGDLAVAVAFLRERCARVVTPTIPLDLGRPRAHVSRIEHANAIIAGAGAVVVDLSDFGARNRVMTDHVHPTAFGQVEIAERAIRALEDPPAVWPSALLSWEETRWRRLRGDATYTYRHAKVSAKAAWLLWRAGSVASDE